MKKSDLKTGMRVEIRNGNIFLVVKDIDTSNYGHQDIAFVNNEGFVCGDSYDDNLNSSYSSIIEVYQVNSNGLDLLNNNFMNLDKKYSIWKRQEYTAEQKEIFKALKTLGFNWIARDKDKKLNAYNVKPNKYYTWWNICGIDEKVCLLNKDNFDFITWEDEQPFEIPEV